MEHIHPSSIFPAVLVIFILWIELDVPYRSNRLNKPHQENLFKREGNDLKIRRLPQAIIIGAKKGGTDALRFWMTHHPNVTFSWKQEPRFFSNKIYNKGLDYYRTYFPESFSYQVTMEKSPQYFHSMVAPERIKQMNSSIRLILTLRDPIKRCISEFVNGKISPGMKRLHRKWYSLLQQQTIDEIIQLPRNSRGFRRSYVVNKSLYHRHYSRWLRYFKKEQIHMVDGDRLIENPIEELKKLEIFLGIGSYFRKEHFTFNNTKGYYCFRNVCLPPRKGHKPTNISKESRQTLKRLLQEDIQLFAVETPRSFLWTQDYSDV